MADIPYHTPILAPQLRELGIPEPWSFGIGNRTTFGELDAVGHVSNVAYFRWFESFRVHYLRDYGLRDYATIKAAPMVLRQTTADYLQEMHLNEDFVVTGRTVSIRNTSMKMEYAVWSGTLRATGSAVLVLLDKDHNKRVIPDDLRAAVLENDGAEDLANR